MTKKIVYTVYDDGILADNKHYTLLKHIQEWDTSSFDTLEEAQAYAALWIGGENPPENLYSMYRSVVEIRQ